MDKDLQFVDPSTTNHLRGDARQCDFCTDKQPEYIVSWQTCIKSPDIFVKLLKFGRLRGIVNILGCKNSECKQDFKQIAKELIERDFLITISGCIAVDMKEAGLMGAGAFQYASEGLTELCNYLSIEPCFYMGSCKDNADMLNFYKMVSDCVGSAAKDLPMAAINLQKHLIDSAISDLHSVVFQVEDDPVKVADIIDTHIHNKRIGLGWYDRYHCSEEKYS